MKNYYANGWLSRYFLKKFINKISIQVQNMSWYIGVEKDYSPELIYKYERQTQLLNELKNLVWHHKI